MNPQENQALDNFLTQLVQARAGVKDPQADAMIAAAIAKQPDAAYLLVQRALLLDQALTSAKAQISSLQSELQTARSSNASSSFLDSENTWGNSTAPHPAAAPSTAAPVAAAPAQSTPASRPGFLSGFGGTLGNIATTAAGVAGGALLFQGIENLFHHSSGNGFLAQPAWGTPASETTVINNYYERDMASDNVRDTASDSNFLDAGLSDDVDFTDDSSII